ncbi:MAG: transposase [Bacilli bacterium]
MNRKERRNKKSEINILEDMIQIINQYFPELINKFEILTDKRNQSYVRYKMKVIFIVRLMGLMCEIKTMQGLTREFNTNETVKNIAQICGLELEELPHCDTINDVFKKIEIEEIEKIIKYMINKLIRNKMLEKYKIRDKYYHIVVDGTGLATSRKRYNKNCIVKNKTDKNGNEYQEYSTYVLEAKLIVGEMAFSIGTEFVENEKEDVKKQDCELNAFKRLAKKIKKEYPRLKIIIGGDALYAAKSVIDICKENGWKYIIRFKEGKIPTLYKEFEKIVEKENESKKANYEYVTKLDYQEEKVNIIKYQEKEKNIEFVYMTDLQISNKNIETTIGIGRKRWKIENEGFNIQKNRTFDIGHLYSKNSTAIKVHYLTIQIAHIIRQLIEKGLKSIKELQIKLKEISQSIKKALISLISNLETHKRVQLRFD